jgi:hypothetical protein
MNRKFFMMMTTKKVKIITGTRNDGTGVEVIGYFMNSQNTVIEKM